jgi:hypothetical protein
LHAPPASDSTGSILPIKIGERIGYLLVSWQHRNSKLGSPVEETLSPQGPKPRSRLVAESSERT